MGLLDGKRGLVLGIANERSIAYGIAKAASEAGATLALTYQNDRLAPRVQRAAEAFGAKLVLPCDVTDDAQLDALAARVSEAWGGLDFLVHAVAFAKREELGGRFVDASRDGFATAMDISVYSLVALARRFESLLAKHHGSVLCLTYFGGEKVVPNYNIMGVAKAALDATVRYLAADLGPAGVRVNALSAGPIKTLSAAGISGLRGMLQRFERQAPLRRNVRLDDIGGAAVFALSDLAAAVTGEVLHVDAGYNILGAAAVGSTDGPDTTHSEASHG